jgi:Flp pilus assembly protein TadD
MMKPTNYMKIAKSSLLVTAALSSLGLGVVVASSVQGYVSPKQAKAAEKLAAEALTMKNYREAIAQGEIALSGAPRDAEYRLLLGQANLSAGRFASAETLFNDVLTLDPTNARAALNLALTQTALDHANEARATLEIHKDQIAVSDYGLALALAGDTPTAIRVLESAARADGATAKTRQNLALSYALSGRWEEAKATASQDLAPDLVDKRMSDWAEMAHPKAAWEQVASLLHVTPVNDPGLPYRLALNGTPSAPVVAEAKPEPVAPLPAALPTAPAALFETASAAQAVAPSENIEPQPQPASVAVAEPAPSPAPERVVAVRHHTVKHLAAAPIIRAATGPAKRMVATRARVKAAAISHRVIAYPANKLVAHHSFKQGHFAVQIGSYRSVALAQAAWKRDVHKVAALRNYDPAQSHFKLRSASYYRLAVTGFGTREAAGQVCTKLRAAGSSCFVRSVSGDQLASWMHKRGDVQLAAHAQKTAPKLTAKVLAKAASKSVPKPILAQAKAAAKPATKPVHNTAQIKAQAMPGGQLAARR